MMDKKAVGAVTGERLGLNFYSIVALALIFGAFYALFSLSGNAFDQRIQATMQQSDASPYFTTALRSPTATGSSVATVLVQSALANDYAQVTEIMKGILKKAPQPPRGILAGWNMRLRKLPEQREVLAIDTFAKGEPIRTLTYQIPLPEGMLELEFSMNRVAAGE